MKRLVIEPDGWPCTLEECPPGLFVSGKALCMKTEYRNNAGLEEVYNEAGEVFWGGAADIAGRSKLIVQPVRGRWEDD